MFQDYVAGGGRRVGCGGRRARSGDGWQGRGTCRREWRKGGGRRRMRRAVRPQGALLRLWRAGRTRRGGARQDGDRRPCEERGHPEARRPVLWFRGSRRQGLLGRRRSGEGETTRPAAGGSGRARLRAGRHAGGWAHAPRNRRQGTVQRAGSAQHVWTGGAASVAQHDARVRFYDEGRTVRVHGGAVRAREGDGAHCRDVPVGGPLGRQVEGRDRGRGASQHLPGASHHGAPAGRANHRGVVHAARRLVRSGGGVVRRRLHLDAHRRPLPGRVQAARELSEHLPSGRARRQGASLGVEPGEDASGREGLPRPSRMGRGDAVRDERGRGEDVEGDAGARTQVPLHHGVFVDRAVEGRFVPRTLPHGAGRNRPFAAGRAAERVEGWRLHVERAEVGLRGGGQGPVRAVRVPLAGRRRTVLPHPREHAHGLQPDDVQP